MAQKFIFDNKQTILPGVYTAFQSGIDNPLRAVTFGKTLIIDTGLGAGFAGGPGINGELEQGLDAVKAARRLSDFQNLMNGGQLWLIGEPLFLPLGAGGPAGVPEVLFVKAATTTAANVSISFVGGGANGGNFTFKCKDEGIGANGVDNTSNVLIQGIAVKMRTSNLDPNKYVLDFYRGTFKGLDSDGEAYDFISSADAQPKLLLSSPQFNNVQTLIDWANKDSAFNSYFQLDAASTATGSGIVDAADLTANAGNILASGGTETYDSLQDVLDTIGNLDYTFVLALDSADNAQSTDNSLILSHLTQSARFRKFMYIGGGDDQDAFQGTNSSVETAQFFDSERVTVVHAGSKISRRGAAGFKNRNSLYKTASVVGRRAGLAPQLPLTFKRIQMAGDRHELKPFEREIALENGVLATVKDEDLGGYIVLQDINTLQDNDFFVNDQGDSYEVSIELIKAQLAKIFEINAKIELLGDEDGVNRNTLTPQDFEEWLKAALDEQTATETADGLITSSRNVTVEVQGDAYIGKYSFDPSFPVNKLGILGTVTDSISL